MNDPGGCLGKEPFASPQLARKVLNRWLASKRRRGKLERRPLQIYRCHCGSFHIGGTWN